jgi:hypothetical protein
MDDNAIDVTNYVNWIQRDWKNPEHETVLEVLNDGGYNSCKPEK